MDNDGCAVVAFLAVVALVVFGVFGVSWYQASTQAEVYRRQGVQMTTWECFMGAKPVERSIREAK